MAMTRRSFHDHLNAFCKDTGAFLLPSLLPLREKDRVLVLDDSALADTLAARGGLTKRPTVLRTRLAGAERGEARADPRMLPLRGHAARVLEMFYGFAGLADGCQGLALR